MPLPFPNFYYPLDLGRKELVRDADKKPTASQGTAEGHDSAGFERAILDSEAAGYQESQTNRLERMEWRRFDADSVLKQLLKPGVHVVVGEPGSGKTVLLTRWAAQVSLKRIRDCQSPIPLLLRLRERAKLEHDCRGVGLLTARLKDMAERRGVLGIQQLPWARLAKAPLIFLLDGLDELTEAGRISWCELAKELGKHHAVIVSCRTAIYSQSWLGQEAFSVMSLLPQQRRNFLQQFVLAAKQQNPSSRFNLLCNANEEVTRRWLDDLLGKLQAHASLRSLSSSPLLLSFIAYLNQPGAQGIQLPASRGQLYGRIIEVLLDSADSRILPRLDGKGAENFDTDKKAFVRFIKAMLPQVALLRLNLGQTSEELLHPEFTTEVFEQAYINTDSSYEKPKLDQVLAWLEDCGLLRSSLPDEQHIQQSGVTSYQFLHLTLLEYIVAQALQQQGCLGAVKKYWRNPRYEEMLALMLNTEQNHQIIDECLKYLVEEGAQLQQPVEPGRERYRSGLQTALHFITRADLENRETIWVKGLLNSGYYSHLQRLALSCDIATPLMFLEGLAKDGDPDVCQKLAENPNASVEAMFILAEGGNRSIRRGLAENPNLSVEAMFILAEDWDEGVRARLAENPNLSTKAMLILAEDWDEGVRARLAKNLNLSTKAMFILAGDWDEGVRARLAENPNLSTEAILILTKNKDFYWGLGENPSLSGELMLILAKNENWLFRGGVAKNPNLSGELMLILAQDKNELIRARLAENPNLSAEAMLVLAEDRDKGVRARLAENPNLSAEAMFILAEDRDEGVRARLAENPNLSAEAILIFIKNKDFYRGLAKNPNLSAEIMLIWVEDEGSYRGLAENPNLSAEAMLVLAQDKNELIRARLAENPNLSAEAMLVLACCAFNNVRQQIAQHPSIPLEWRSHTRSQFTSILEWPKPPDTLPQSISLPHGRLRFLLAWAIAMMRSLAFMLGLKRSK
jgi:chromosome segregation and condensation protein ScpB